MRRFWLGLAGLVLIATPGWSQAPSGAHPPRPPGLTVAPNAPNDMTEARQDQSSGGAPANICKELVAYFEQQAAKQAEGRQSPQAPAATGASSGGQAPPTDDKAQQSSGQSAPIPKEDSGSTAPPFGMEQARALVESNDVKGCQEAVRRMRRAGTAMPPGLLALGALRPELLERMRAD